MMMYIDFMTCIFWRCMTYIRCDCWWILYVHVVWILMRRRSVYFLNIYIIRVYYRFNRNRALQLFSICCLKATREALVNDCWGVRKGTLTPRSNNGRSDTFTFSEKVDGFVCRPCIKEDGMPYGIDICLIAPGC